MELPIGGAEYDAAAMYRATMHGRPTVNGMSGYLTPRYQAMVRALADREPDALEAVAFDGPVWVAIDTRREEGRSWVAFVAAHPWAMPRGEDAEWRFFRLDAPGRAESEHRVAAAAVPCGPATRRPVAGADANGPVDIERLRDNDVDTWWRADLAHAGRDELTLDLGGTVRICGLVLSLGDRAFVYPRRLHVDASVDGVTWQVGPERSVVGQVLAVALGRPTDARIELVVAPLDARFVKLRLIGAPPGNRWALAELSVRTTP